MIQQPTLGELLVELRKKKGWTQEELVEACNVSVRTIQRIESGEVTPRTSTINLLLEALGYDPGEWKEFVEKDDKKHSSKLFNQMLVLNLTQDEIKKPLGAAWIAGIVYLILTILDFIVELSVLDSITFNEQVGYVTVKVLIAIAFFTFMRGFISLSLLFENGLLKGAAYAYMFSVSLLYLGEAALTLAFPYDDWIWVSYEAGFCIVTGCIGIVFGVALMRLQDGMGQLAKIAGIFEIIMGICFAMVFFAPLGIALFTPAIVLEILLLSRANDLAVKGTI